MNIWFVTTFLRTCKNYSSVADQVRFIFSFSTIASRNNCHILSHLLQFFYKKLNCGSLSRSSHGYISNTNNLYTFYMINGQKSFIIQKIPKTCNKIINVGKYFHLDRKSVV